MTERKWDDLELELLAKAVYDRYGYDFREYADASFRRRVHALLVRMQLRRISDLVPIVIHDSDAFTEVLDGLTVTVTEMFRDPNVYKKIVDDVFPYLRTFSELKVWHPGCATGEEVYSMAILLQEAGLYSRSILYGTDINPRSLSRAKEGILTGDSLFLAQENYLKAGGQWNFEKYYRGDFNAGILNPELQRNIVFSDHNLVTDSKFGSMNLILCRNVLIYFSPPLQTRVLDLLWDSLALGGFLVLGSKERTECSKLPGCHLFSKAERIYQKKA